MPIFFLHAIHGQDSLRAILLSAVSSVSSNISLSLSLSPPLSLSISGGFFYGSSNILSVQYVLCMKYANI
jgi:hypothetical protein